LLFAPSHDNIGPADNRVPRFGRDSLLGISETLRPPTGPGDDRERRSVPESPSPPRSHPAESPLRRPGWDLAAALLHSPASHFARPDPSWPSHLAGEPDGGAYRDHLSGTIDIDSTSRPISQNPLRPPPPRPEPSDAR